VISVTSQESGKSLIELFLVRNTSGISGFPGISGFSGNCSFWIRPERVNPLMPEVRQEE
jgi:hypothetical protein